MGDFSVSLEVTERGKKAPQYSLESDINGEVTLKDTLVMLQNTIKTVTKTVLKEEQDRGFDKDPTIFVDGSPRKPLELVSPFGEVDIISKQDLGPILIEIYTLILKRSPVETGYYYFNNVVFLNDTEIASNKQELINYLKANPNFQSSDKIKFINLAPYARKNERMAVVAGRKGTKKVNKRKNRTYLGAGTVYKPNGVYVLTERAVARKYGRLAFIRFGFTDGGAIQGLKGNNRTYKTGTRKGKPYFYPTITVSVVGKNITNLKG